MDQPCFTPEEHALLEATAPQLRALATPSIRAGAGAPTASLPSWLTLALPLLEKLLAAYLANPASPTAKP